MRTTTSLFLLLALPLLQGATTPQATEILRNALRIPAGIWDLQGKITTTPITDTPTASALKEGDFDLSIRLESKTPGRYRIILIPEKPLPQATIEIQTARYPISISYTDSDGKQLLETCKPWLGTAFSLEDLAFEFLTWKESHQKKDETIRGRDCYQINCYASELDGSPYSMVEAWIDKEYGAVIRAQAHRVGGDVVREFEIRSFQKLGNQWMLKQLEIRAPLQNAKSRISITSGVKLSAD